MIEDYIYSKPWVATGHISNISLSGFASQMSEDDLTVHKAQRTPQLFNLTYVAFILIESLVMKVGTLITLVNCIRHEIALT